MRRRSALFFWPLFVAAASAGADIGANPSDPAASPRAGGTALTAASDIERALGKLERERRELERRRDALGERIASAQERILVRGRAYTRIARAGLLPIGGGFQALVDHAARLERLRRGIKADLVEQRQATIERARAITRLEELAAQIGPLAAEQQALVRAETALLSAEDRDRAFHRAFETSSAANHTAVYGALGPSDPAQLRAGFAGMKGRLPFPIAGRTEIRRARRSASEGPGVEMHAPLGTPVRAVYPGRVAFADTYADFGKTVILDHGGRYYTVTANLGSIDVAVGDEVAQNDRLGTVGDSERGALVYFEIRVGTGTSDPTDWFGI